MATDSQSGAQGKNAILKDIGRDTFEYEISKYLMPYERFLLSATCQWLNSIFNISSFDFSLHSKLDLRILKTAIIDKYFGSKKSYRHSSNCIDLSNQKYASLSCHEKLCIKYVLIFQQKLPEYFPTNSFQSFLTTNLKLTFTENDSDYADSIVNFLRDTIIHQNSGIGSLIHNLHLDNIGLNSSNHLSILSNKILTLTPNIRYLYLAHNPLINDECIQDLFLCIAANNHYLEVLDLSNTCITNKTCDIIYDFCESVYKINNGGQAYGAYSSDENESVYILNNDKESQSEAMQEIIYMSSEGSDNDEEESLDFSTDDEFDTIGETKMVSEDIVCAKPNENVQSVAVETILENIEESKHDRDEEKEVMVRNDVRDWDSYGVNDVNVVELMEEKAGNVVLFDENNQSVGDTGHLMNISWNKMWIDLKNNKMISTDGIDKLNQIYVKKIEPARHFVLCVEGCCYEPNPNWDLSLL